MPTIYLIRHAESTANTGGISLPNAEIPLSPTGKQQAQQLANSLTLCPSQIMTSAYLRTQETAQPWLDKLGMQAQSNPLLNEFTMIGYNIVKGLNGAQRLPYALNYRKRADLELRMGEDGETFREFYQRVDTFLQQLPNLQDQTVCFTHGFFIRLIIWRLLGMSIETQAQLREFFNFHGIAIANTAVFQLHWQSSYLDAGIKLLPEQSPVTQTQHK